MIRTLILKWGTRRDQAALLNDSLIWLQNSIFTITFEKGWDIRESILLHASFEVEQGRAKREQGAGRTHTRGGQRVLCSDIGIKDYIPSRGLKRAQLIKSSNRAGILSGVKGFAS